MRRRKRTLADYKAIAVQFRELVACTKDTRTKNEYRRVLAHAQAKINRLESGRLTVRQWLVLAVLVYLAGFATGCCTLNGLGKDMQNATSKYVENSQK